MRKLLLSALFAMGFILTGMVSASAVIGPGINNKAATNFSPRVRQAAKGCREEEECDHDGKNCRVVHRCR
jgi:hypothetical protein